MRKAAIAIWAGVTMLLATHLWIALGSRHALAAVVAWVAAQTMPWLVIALALLAVAPRARTYAAGAVAAVIVAPLGQSALMALLRTLDVPEVFGVTSSPVQMIVSKLPSSIVTYAAIAATVHLVRMREVRARLEAEARAAELRALHARLQPHFLFNAIHSVVSLIDEDPEAARSMLLRLSDLLRLTLQADAAARVPLDAELRWSELYLAVERVRFEDRLEVRIDASEDARRALVPALILQPLVENAVKHGIAAREDGGLLSIRARTDGDAVRVAIETPDGADSTRPGFGIGLEATRERLRLLYGERASVSLTRDGTTSSLALLLPRGEAA